MNVGGSALHSGQNQVLYTSCGQHGRYVVGRVKSVENGSKKLSRETKKERENKPNFGLVSVGKKDLKRKTTTGEEHSNEIVRALPRSTAVASAGAASRSGVAPRRRRSGAMQ